VVHAASTTADTVSLSSSALDLAAFTESLNPTLAEPTLALAEPTLASLGLCSWAPSGWVQSALETLHVGLDVPWWGAIVIGTICIRVAIFPLVILAQRNAALMHNNLPTMMRLQEKMTVARQQGDQIEAVKVSNELVNYMQRNGINPFMNILPPLAQLPIFMSVFVGLRAMATLPVDSMKTGGMLWFTDLTIADPIYALPLFTMVTLLGTIELGVDGMKADQMQKNMKYLFRAMPFICFPFIIQFPSAMLCYWFTSNAFSLVQVLALRIPGVRPYFNIPPLMDHGLTKNIRPSDTPKKTMMQSFRESMQNAQLAADIEERQRYNALRLKQPTRPIAPKSISEHATETKSTTEVRPRTDSTLKSTTESLTEKRQAEKAKQL
jgi:YidC/Oxa1 family membrane protein insertase